MWDLVVARPSPGCHAARNAIIHIQKAAVIREIDPAMAFFRVLTAEEEASRAVIHALHRLQYPHASRLKWKWHVHKFALVPFVQAIQDFAKALPGSAWRVWIDPEQGPQIAFRAPQLPQGQWVQPDPPLSGRLRVGSGPFDFRPIVVRMLSDDGIEGGFLPFVEERADLRSRLLYARDQGVPGLPELPEERVQQGRDNVFAMLVTYLLVDMHPVQALVEDALAGFVRLLERMPEVEFD